MPTFGLTEDDDEALEIVKENFKHHPFDISPDMVERDYLNLFIERRKELFCFKTKLSEKLKIITFDEWLHWRNTRRVLFEKTKK